jgi:hypothetical protein
LEVEVLAVMKARHEKVKTAHISTTASYRTVFFAKCVQKVKKVVL